MSNEILQKEIDLIQSCVSRMASNSFLLKGWSVSIAAVVLALSEKDAKIGLSCAIVSLPLLSFWYLDAFFLRTERMYRKLYEWVINNRPAGDTTHLYDLNPHRFSCSVSGIFRTMFSQTLLLFYGVPLLLMSLIATYSFFVKP